MRKQLSPQAANRRSLHRLLAVIALTLCFLCIFAGVLFSQLFNRVYRDAVITAQDKVVLASEKTNDCLTKAKSTVLSNADTVEYMISRGVSNEALLSFLVSQTEERLSDIDESFTGFYGYIRGEYLDGNGWDPYLDDPDYAPTTRPWYVTPLRHPGEVVFTTPYLDMDTGKMIVSVAKLLEDGESVFAMDVSLREISSFAEDLPHFGSDYAYIIDSTGTVVSSRAGDDFGKNYLTGSTADPYRLKGLFEKALSTDDSFPYSVAGKEYLVFSARVESGWEVILLSDPDEVFVRQRQNTRIAAVFFVALLGLIAYFSVHTWRDLRARAEALKQEQRQRAVIHSISRDCEAIYCVDPVTDRYEVLLDWSGAAAALPKRLEFSNSFFADAQRNLQRVVCEEDRAPLARQLQKDYVLSYLKEHDELRVQYRMTEGGTPIWYEIRGIRSCEEEDTLFFSVHNIDAVVKKEKEEARLLQEALERAQASDLAKTTFLFNMSHDVRTPMNAILGFTDIARSHLDDRARALDALDKVKSSGEHLLSILNDVLDMSRIEQGSMVLDESPVDLTACCQELLVMVEDLARARNVRLIVEDGIPPHTVVRADRMRMSRIFLNVLSNAVKYTPAGGSVTLTTRAAPDEKTPGCLVIESVIRDTGIGMSPEFLAHIYEPFSRERNSTVSGVEGTGLGMAITKELVELTGGSIRIESEQGKGTSVFLRFSFWLDQSSSVGEGPAEEGAGTDCLAGTRALLVEDNELNREIAAEILSSLDIAVDAAEDGSVAVEKCAAALERGSLDYDFILMDIQMPVMDGYAATRELRRLFGAHPALKRIPIIAMTANAFAEDRQRAQEAGMDAYLAKPINVAELVDTLTAYAQGRVPDTAFPAQ